MTGSKIIGVNHNFRLDFISHKRNFVLDCSLPVKDFVDFLKIFDTSVTLEDNKVTWRTIRQVDSELQASVKYYIETNRKVYSVLKKLFHDFFNQLVEGEFFFVLNHSERTTSDFVELWKQLGRLNRKAINSPFDESYYDWGTTVLNYNIDFIGTERKSFGNNKCFGTRLCRFCYTEEGKVNSFGSLVKFNKKAHLISEALGNKRLVSIDECDHCNDYFSQTLEPSIVNFFAPFRSLYGIPGKRGKKKLKGTNFELDPETGFDIKFPGTLLDFQEGCFKVKLEMQEGYIPVDVYKCLVKFILAVIPIEEMSIYSKTINWLYDESSVCVLPKVTYLKNASFYTEHPYLVKYKRHTTDRSFPDLIGEFRYGDIVLIFIIPFGNLDQLKFINDEEISCFWEGFIGLRKGLPWKFVDFSNTALIKMGIDLKVDNIKLGVNAFLSKGAE